MKLSEKLHSALRRNAGRSLAAIAAVVFVGGGLFYASAARTTGESAMGQSLSGPSIAEFGAELGLRALSTPLAVALTPIQQTVYCASDDGRRNYCAADTRGGVRLVNQRSGSPCTRNRTWGVDRQGIWVDRGCRAEFEVSSYDDRRDRDYGRRGRDRDRDYDRGRGGRGRDVQTFYCESGDEKRHYCAEGNEGRVRLIRQRSGSPCIQGRTFGRDGSGFFVDRGCRADFEVTR
jgi:hypothetical protein